MKLQTRDSTEKSDKKSSIHIPQPLKAALGWNDDEELNMCVHTNTHGQKQLIITSLGIKGDKNES